MVHVSRYIIALVIGGASVVSFWVYQKYIRDVGPEEVSVVVERGDIEEIIHSRGEAVSSSEYSLEFPSAGVVSAVYVNEGKTVARGAPLMKLDTNELALDKERLSSLLNQRAADLQRLLAGATVQDIAVYEAKVASARIALSETEKSEILALRAVSSAMDDAIRGTTDLFFTNPLSVAPQLSFFITDFALKTSLEDRRLTLGVVLNRVALIAATTSTKNLHAAAVQVQKDAQSIGVFLDDSAIALNLGIAGTINSTTREEWQSAVASARVTLNTKTSALAAAEEARAAAEAALVVAEKELAARVSPPRPEDLSAAQAAVGEIESQIKIVAEQIRKSTLVAPEAGRVIEVNYKAGETFRPGSPAVIFHAPSLTVRSDISELDVVRVREQDGNPARVEFDALPGAVYIGKVTSVEPHKIEKEGDTYYRVNFSLDRVTDAIRPGMTAEVSISVSRKENVLRIPEYATRSRDGKHYVLTKRDGVTAETEVVLGISDGEYREVVSGLSENDTVIISAE